MSPTARRAPAVRFPVQRSRTVGGVLAAIALAGAVVLAAWLVLGGGEGLVPAMAGVGVWLAAAGGAWHWWRSQWCGVLYWDGGQWVLDSLLPGQAPLLLRGAPEVQWDLQSHLWVCVHGAAGRSRFWLWLERRHQPERWVDLRRAVYSRAGTDTASAGEFAPTHSQQA